MEVYLDNAATTRVFDSVKNIMMETLGVDYGNPSSMHQKGIDAEKYIKDARELLAKSLKVDTKEIIFTSGGTESNNMAVIGTAYGYKRSGNHIITTRIEHPSIHNPLLFLEENGYRVSYIPVDQNGNIIMEELLNAVCNDTILVSVMYVNNEVGSVQNISEISKRIKEKNPKVLLHVDAIQAFGKYRIYPRREGIDLLSISGHKIHGPKGSGVLYVRDKVKIKPILFGGGQQKGMRSGTENVPAIAGIGQAVSDIYENHEQKRETLYQLKRTLIEGVKQIEGVTVNCLGNTLTDTAPHIVSVSFDGIRSEVLLHALEDKGIYVSSGSACASNHPDLSGTLKAIGLKENLLDSTLRFSFSVFTTMEDIEYTINILNELVPVLRKYSRH
ncbi:aminotransferase class V-fold PLP-dependent enzyme [Anaerocolumna sedimenticola]|uniref:Aminotransferase class V-fold PLP-dependent enzyme n=1 Tax=Anaerocolumna sedimenticola TaxID=2696063 RepID=A0A6P1TP23_9FIRM|nr:cysteine desulfurase family protein [Anaerocolumna sedimenticola]QHQ61932.1 aminotransferase class V-fold PLP-dependent enzyme [Anaerocolumna sedimenticola]